MTNTLIDPAIAPARPRKFRLPCDTALANMSTTHVAKVMDVSPRTVQRWMIKGVDGWTGDKLAVKVIGVDGYTLWGSDFDRAFEDTLTA